MSLGVAPGAVRQGAAAILSRISRPVSRISLQGACLGIRGVGDETVADWGVPAKSACRMAVRMEPGSGKERTRPRHAGGMSGAELARASESEGYPGIPGIDIGITDFLVDLIFELQAY